MSAPPFDRLADTVFKTTTDVFGYDATWLPSNGGEIMNARVHLKEPNNEFELAGFEFNPRTHIMEWRKGDFSGLESNSATGNESVTVNGSVYHVLHVKAVADGKTFQAVMEKQ